MAKLPDLDFNMKAWDEWVESRPPVVQDLCRRYPPDRLYRIKDSGHRCTLVSYSEDGTMKVNVTGQFNFVTFDRQVFGIKPENLEECDLPGADEHLGTALTEKEDIDAFVDLVRPAVLAGRKKDADS